MQSLLLIVVITTAFYIQAHAIQGKT